MKNLSFDRCWVILFGLMLLFIAAVTIGADMGRIPTKFFGITYSDKVGHLILYGTLAGLLHLALKRRTIPLGRIQIPLALLIVCVLAAVDEGQQAFMPHRAFDLSDYAANVIGALLFIGMANIRANAGHLTLTETKTGLK